MYTRKVSRSRTSPSILRTRQRTTKAWLHHIDTDTFTDWFLWCTLEQLQIDTGIPQPLYTIPFKNYRIMLTEICIKKLWIFLDEYNITLISRKTSRLPLIKIGKTFLTKLLTNLGFKVTNLIQLNICRLAKRDISLVDIARGDGRGFRKKLQGLQIQPKKIHYFWPKEKPGSCDKNYGQW